MISRRVYGLWDGRGAGRLELTEHLSDLVSASNITGHESGVAQILLREWAPLVDEVGRDRLGNCIGLKRGNGSGTSLGALWHPGPGRPSSPHGQRAPGPLRVMAAAHMDSIGMMVTAVEPGGFLRFTAVGGVDQRLLMAQEVEVHGRRQIPGLIASVPRHLSTAEERSRLPTAEQLYIDTGLAEAEVRASIPIGSPITPKAQFRRLQNGRIASRHLDNRASLAALRLALAELQGVAHAADFYAVGTVGEEFGGLPGAVTAAYAINPDIAIAVDVTFARHPGSEEDSFALGGGPTIGVGPNCTPRLARFMREAAEAAAIDYQIEVLPGHSGTDAWGIQVVRGGIATGILSIPIRYMHTPVETVDMADLTAAGRLLAAVLSQIDAALVEELRCY